MVQVRWSGMCGGGGSVASTWYELLADAVRKHGKQIAMITDSADGVREMIALGATIVNYSSDAAVLRAGYASIVADARR